MISSEKEIYALVSSTRALLLIELNSKRVTALEWNRGEYYGISWFPGSEDLVLTHSLVDNAQLVDVETYAQSEVGVLSAGARQTHGFLSQPHQILCGSDGRVICTNTGRNSICVLDLARPDVVQEARISSARWDRLDTHRVIGDHLNSIFEADGVLYVIAHGHSKGSALVTFSYPDLNLLSIEAVKNHSGLHNIWVTGEGQRIACNSESGSLIELNSNTVLWESGRPIYSRGVAATPDFVLVGESEKSAREMRRATMSGLWLIDRKTWQPIDFIHLGPYGGVHDVRLLNVPDEAHHGHVFSGTAALLARDRDKERAQSRILASNRIQQSRAAWKSFEVVFGTPEVGGDGGLKVGPDHLCLIIQSDLKSKESSEVGLEFDYEFDASTAGGHLSVVDYRGKGQDTDMSAVLIQRINDAETSLSRWLHDGRGWAAQGEQFIAGLPLRGRVRLTRSAAGIQLDIDGHAIPSEFLEELNAPYGRLGVRWSGVALYSTDRTNAVRL
ncbi:hypothetical protein [Paraburkholderia domus]|uniref:hypothetical protein n=1 Tax=Paraburkholderia domus TaxID=2793075 RepID=UPI001B1D9F8F|nr:hypothetical protein [Paraburkholderia domus]CAE6726330.1 hypothetical protein R75483_01995 [Paraburkholderia domus]